MKKLWQKNTTLLKRVEDFTVGNDRQFDMELAPYDVLGSIAHAKMLADAGLLSSQDAAKIIAQLKVIFNSIDTSQFKIDEDVEDIHSQIELMLTQKLGDTGKRIHTARSRNDQVLVDIKLFLRSKLQELVESASLFFDLLQTQSEKYKDYLFPGYTHLQLAMPSSFGLWFGAYAESLVDDMRIVRAAYDVVNKNPLGSAAGYGSSFPIDRSQTTELLGFSDLNYNVVYAQMGRGKTERIVAMALVNVADTLSKLSMDACLYLNQNFDFISFPAELTTGSSIMPHKKNPDVFELIRSHCNRIKSLPNEIMIITTNLPSGYHRDLQLLKEHLFPAFVTLRDCIEMAGLMLSNIQIKMHILDDERYKYLFTVEEVNKLVMAGIPFREAYKIVGQKVEDGSFVSSPVEKMSKGTHEGSIGNLCNEEIRRSMQEIIDSFPFRKVHESITELLR